MFGTVRNLHWTDLQRIPLDDDLFVEILDHIEQFCSGRDYNYYERVYELAKNRSLTESMLNSRKVDWFVNDKNDKSWNTALVQILLANPAVPESFREPFKNEVSSFFTGCVLKGTSDMAYIEGLDAETFIAMSDFFMDRNDLSEKVLNRLISNSDEFPNLLNRVLWNVNLTLKTAIEAVEKAGLEHFDRHRINSTPAGRMVIEFVRTNENFKNMPDDYIINLLKISSKVGDLHGS